jgi:hypothetical protein
MHMREFYPSTLHQTRKTNMTSSRFYTHLAAGRLKRPGIIGQVDDRFIEQLNHELISKSPPRPSPVWTFHDSFGSR